MSAPFDFIKTGRERYDQQKKLPGTLLTRCLVSIVVSCLPRDFSVALVVVDPYVFFSSSRSSHLVKLTLIEFPIFLFSSSSYVDGNKRL